MMTMMMMMTMICMCVDIGRAGEWARQQCLGTWGATSVESSDGRWLPRSSYQRLHSLMAWRARISCHPPSQPVPDRHTRTDKQTSLIAVPVQAVVSYK